MFHRLGLSTFCAALLVLTHNGAGLATNWGAGDEGSNCVEEDPNTMCTPESGSVYFYFDSNVPADLKSAMINSINNDYHPLADIEGFIDASLDSVTDVRIRYGFYQAGNPWAYSTCAAGAVHSDGNGYYSACRLQYIRFNPNAVRMQECLADPTGLCLHFIACHEIGHTYGLSHAKTSRATCTNYEDYTYLDAHDKEHLVDCYPKPNPIQTNRTLICETFAG